MRQSAMKTTFKIASSILGVGVIVYFVTVWYVSKTFRLDFPLDKGSGPSLIDKIVNEAVKTNEGMRNGTIPWRKIDTRSVGMPEEEQKLLALNSAIEYFVLRVGSMPHNIDELLTLSTMQDYPKARRTLGRSMVKDCELVNTKPDSYLLNCDGLPIPREAEIQVLVLQFDSETERFYKIGDHVVWYVPPEVHGKLDSRKTVQ
jgi:hypothetical protein